MGKMQRLPLDLRDRLYGTGEKIDWVAFPLHGVVSLVARMKDGSSAEVATIGNEGLVGFPLLFGGAESLSEAFCQVPGEYLRLSAKDFRNEVARDAAFNQILERYGQAVFHQVAQSAACNRLHAIEQRFCRRILMTQDRVGDDRLPLTHEFLAEMLGVRRASVTLVAAVMQKAGFIRYQRGLIEVLDRQGLESVACECYENVRQTYSRLLT